MEDIDQQHLWPTTLTSSTMAANFNGAFQRQGFNQQFFGVSYKSRYFLSYLKKTDLEYAQAI